MGERHQQNGRHKDPPSQEVEQQLFREYHLKCSRSEEQRNHLVEIYSGLAVRRASAYYWQRHIPRYIDLGDLLSAAFEGLVKAVEDFDPEKGCRFPTYARTKMNGYILDGLRAKDHLARPERKLATIVEKSYEKLLQELQRQPTDDEVMEFVCGQLPRASAQHFARTHQAGVHVIKIYHADESYRDGKNSSFLEKIPVIEHVERESYLRDIERIVNKVLNEREYEVMHLHYHEGLPFRVIGDLMHLSESWVCKIHNRVIERIVGKPSLKEKLQDIAAELAVA